MKFHRMSLCAFGPFAGTETVDFDALSADGLFLLRGQTGSGKTSVLDALTFALYGRVAGSREADQLKSQHAPAQRQPYVELEFSRADQRYLVHRTAVYYRPAKRAGAAPQRENTSATLHRLEGGHWVPIPAARVQEVDSELKDIVGLSLAEFTKVMLLPQGAFAQLLHASNEDRRAILEHLFDTTTYQQIESSLWQRMREVEAEISGVESTLASHLDGFRESAASLLGDLGDLGEPGGPGDLGDVGRLTDPGEGPGEAETAGAEAQRIIQAADQHRQRLQGTASDSADRARRLQEEASELALTHRQLQQWARHTAKVEAHEALRETTDQVRRTMTHHDCATDANRWLAAARQSAAAASEASAEALAATEHAEHLLTASPDVEHRTLIGQDGVDRAALHAALKDTSSLRHHLTTPEAASAEQAYRAAQDEVTRAEGVLAEVRQQREASAAHLSTSRAALEDLHSQLTQCPVVEGEAEDAAAELQHLKQAQRIITRRDAAHQKHRTAEQQAQAQRQIVDAAEAHARAQASAHLESLAFELAGELSDGEPCLVCGSTEHPDPLKVTPETVSREDVNAALEARREQDSLLQQHAARAEAAGAEAEQATQELHELQEVQGRGVSLELTSLTVEKAVADQQERVIKLRQQKERHRDLADRLEAAREEAVNAEREDTARHHAVQRQQEQCQHDRDHAVARADAVAGLRANYDSLQQRQDAVETLEVALQRAVEATDAAASAAQRAQEASASAQHRMDELGFATAEEVQASILADADYRAAQSQVQEFDATTEHLKYSAADEDIAGGRTLATDGVVDPGQDAVQAAQTAAHEQQASASADHDRATGYASRFTALGEAGARIQELERRRDSFAAEQIAVQTLAPTLNGQGENSLKMRLTTYVLAARLEKIVESATRHLSVMTDGRYHLRLDAERGGRGLRGLDLKVYDEYGDTERPTESLSGGETFMTALSMALGLAETVQTEAGGIDLDSLFIDEGFGSLDEQTLDSVMSALHSLQGEGRRVGVVSHVSEMHQQIPAQLRVTKTRRGSTLQMVVPQ